MYNKAMSVYVTSTTPTANEDANELTTNMAIVFVTPKVGIDILDDLGFGDAKTGLATLLGVNQPIKFPVSLVYVPGSAVLIFPGCDPMQCELSDIEITKPDSKKLMVAKLKVRLEHIKSRDAGIIVSNLKRTIDITIESIQMDIFE